MRLGTIAARDGPVGQLTERRLRETLSAMSAPGPSPISDRLVPWVGGRADLFAALPATVQRFDPWLRSSAPFLAEVRALDHLAWAEPLGRVRPSWVFYDCALVPGALFGYALAPADVPPSLTTVHPLAGLVPVSLLALIPTLDGPELVQSLAARELPGLSGDELAIRTLRAGVAALGARELIVAIPWTSTFVARFLALAPLRVHTAWTPAHDEPRTVTLSLTPHPSVSPARPHPGSALDLDDTSLQALQAELEQGAVAWVQGLSSAGQPLVTLTRPEGRT